MDTRATSHLQSGTTLHQTLRKCRRQGGAEMWESKEQALAVKAPIGIGENGVSDTGLLDQGGCRSRKEMLSKIGESTKPGYGVDRLWGTGIGR